MFRFVKKGSEEGDRAPSKKQNIEQVAVEASQFTRITAVIDTEH